MTVRDRMAGFVGALALSLAIAIGGVVLLDGGNAQASGSSNVLSAAPAPDAEACSTSGWYNPGYYSEGGVVYVPTITAMPYAPYAYPFGYWDYPFVAPVVTATAVTIPPTAYVPYDSQPYTSPTHVNYACNAFDNCVPVASDEAVVCPGNPASVALNAATTATCASAMNIDARVVGSGGLIVANGTPVLFSTTLGMVPGDTTTDDGIASVSLVFPPKTTGTATLTVTSGAAKAETKITVTC